MCNVHTVVSPRSFKTLLDACYIVSSRENLSLIKCRQLAYQFVKVGMISKVLESITKWAIVLLLRKSKKGNENNKCKIAKIRRGEGKRPIHVNAVGVMMQEAHCSVQVSMPT